MQQPMPTTMNMMPQFPSTNITTEQIQKYLDENKTLILAILDNQNLGKLAECAQYQAQLQKNLMYLAAIADAQPPTQQPTPPQMPPHPAMQQGVNYMQQPPQGVVPHQPSGFPPKSPLQFTPQQMQEHQRQQQLQHQQAFSGHMSIRPGMSNGLQGMHMEGNLGGSSIGGPSSNVGSAGLTDASRGGAGPMDAREGKQDGAEGGSGDGQGYQAAGSNSANEDLSNRKGSEDPK